MKKKKYETPKFEVTKFEIQGEQMRGGPWWWWWDPHRPPHRPPRDYASLADPFPYDWDDPYEW